MTGQPKSFFSLIFSQMPSKFEEITVVAGYLGSELISLLPDAARNLEKGWRHMVRDASP
jgi:hypothetical protein